MADIDLMDAQQALADASLLRTAASDMTDDVERMRQQAMDQLGDAAGAERDAFQSTLDAYYAAFRRLAGVYDDLGTATIRVIEETLRADQEAASNWARTS
jgi:uncharacterized protein YukE